MSNILKTLAAGSASEPTDEYFNQTTLLLHGDGTNGAQNNTFLDSSSNTFTITRNGNTTQGTFSPFSEGWSNYFDGTGDYLETPSSSDLAFGTGDFCVEFWIYRTVAGQDGIYSNSAGVGGGDAQFEIQVNASNKVILIGWSTTFMTSSASLGTNAWSHVAVVRSGTSMAIFINGNREATATSSNNFSSTNTFYIGAQRSSAANPVTGYISNLRAVKGASVYDPAQTTITVPTAPLTAIANTELLTCQSNRFVDNSTNNFAITPAGNVAVQPFSPFAPSAAYSPSVNGGSGYFDGTGDYLTVGSTTSVPTTGDFTVSFWTYNFTSSGDTTPVYLNGNSSSFAAVRITNVGVSGIRLFMSTSGSAWAISSGNLGTSTLNRWSFISLVRDGGTMRLYQDGTEVYNSTAISSGTSLMTGDANRSYIGAIHNGGIQQPYFGYVSNVRVETSALYPSGTTFTPPTAPLSPTGSRLCLDFTNAGIFDNTGKNNLETVGNAQIDTATKKYGTGSMEFDGTGDWLFLPSNPNLAFGTGDFTIEAWVYVTTGVPQYNGIFSSAGTGSTDIQFQLQDERIRVSSYTAEIIVSDVGDALSLNTWTHVAVTRSGTTIRLFKDGVLIKSGSDSTNWTQSGARVGVVFATTYPMNGYIDDLRITKGVARYTTTFTPPDKAFPDQ